jgi:hypothetical protein
MKVRITLNNQILKEGFTWYRGKPQYNDFYHLMHLECTKAFQRTLGKKQTGGLIANTPEIINNRVWFCTDVQTWNKRGDASTTETDWIEFQLVIKE